MGNYARGVTGWRPSLRIVWALAVLSAATTVQAQSAASRADWYIVETGADNGAGPAQVAAADPAPMTPRSAPPTERSASAKAALFRDSAEGRDALQGAKQRSAEETYQLLLPLEPRYAGDVDFDYLLGTSALDAGHDSAAVFALQRAVASSPGFSGARLELARAYFAIGDNESARREFLALRSEQPPPQVADVIAQYLDAIDRRSATYRTRYSALLEAGGGYDSNANGATDSQVFLGFNLNDRSRAQESPYYGVSAAGQLSVPLAPRWRFLLDGGAMQRNFPQASFVDTTLARLGSGIEWSREQLSISGVVSGTYAALDGRRNNTNVAFDLTTLYGSTEAWQMAVAGRAAALRFADGLSIQNVDSYLGSLSLIRYWNGSTRVQLVAAGTGGVDRAKEEGSPFGRNLYGGRLSVFAGVTKHVVLSASAAGLKSDYDGTFFGQERRDDQYSGRLGVDLKDLPAQRWGIGTQVTYIHNRSSVSLFQYHRFDASLVLRREFR